MPLHSGERFDPGHVNENDSIIQHDVKGEAKFIAGFPNSPRLSCAECGSKIIVSVDWWSISNVTQHNFKILGVSRIPTVQIPPEAPSLHFQGGKDSKTCAGSHSYKGKQKISIVNRWNYLKYYKKTQTPQIRAKKPGLFEWLAGTTR